MVVYMIPNARVTLERSARGWRLCVWDQYWSLAEVEISAEDVGDILRRERLVCDMKRSDVTEPITPVIR